MVRTRSADGRCLGLDVARAVAVLMVLFSHWSGHFGYWFGTPLAPATMDIAGDTGVEIFFALSGLLIGRILIKLLGTRATWQDLRVFMLRRALRTLPLYFVWLSVLLTVFPPRHDMAATALRFATMTQNLLWPMPPDYYFAVTWSLAVEDWFYLLFAGLLIALTRRFGRRQGMPWALALIMLPPLALRLITADRIGIVAWRLDEIAYGVLLACLLHRKSCPAPLAYGALAGGILLLAACLGQAVPLPPLLRTALTPNLEVIGAALCLPAALRLTHAPAWFATSASWIASRSYALYLTHLTVLYDVAEVSLFEPGRLSALGCIAVALVTPFLLAELSFRLIERPAMRLRPEQASGRLPDLAPVPAG